MKTAEYGAIFGGAGVHLGSSSAVLYENCFILAGAGGIGVESAAVFWTNSETLANI